MWTVDAWQAFDYDGDGLLELDEGGTLLQMFGTVMTEAEVPSLL